MGSLLLFCVLTGLGGCSKFKAKLADQYVYVTAKETFLRDRVAAVSNRTATVQNGERLKVLEHGRRFVRVQTPNGEQGWIDEKTVATQATYELFDQLKDDHKGDSTVASGVVRDDVYLHLKPGRDTERFYRLAEGERLKLLRRATLEKAVTPGTVPLVKLALPVGNTDGKRGSLANSDIPEAPPMEDWWLVRDSQGHTGWLLSRMMDVDAPDAITRYAEGKRIVGAYVLTKVYDSEAPMDDKNVPIYVTVLSPYKAGLAYDFDQVRVFTWSLQKHRYETGFRDKNVEGYLPVDISHGKDPYGKTPVAQADLPIFRFRVLSADAPAVVPDAATGAVVPGKTITKTYRLEGNQVRRLMQVGEIAQDEAHPEPEPEKKKGWKKRH